jgi:hypothetical protein
MPYVTRCRHDLFVSYSHQDDHTWIAGFEQGLRAELREKLGTDPGIWQDAKDIRFGQNWKDEIKEGITGSAVFLAILSPGYQISEWCGRERKCFLEQFPKADDMKVPLKVGSAYRFLKIIKTPWDEDAHLEFFAEAQHLDFFQRDAAGIDRELMPGTEPFRVRLEEAAHHIAALLKSMRRMGESVFVASPAEDVAESCESLRNELRAQGYVVRPEGPLDSLYSDKAIRKEIDPALLSIHLLGGRYDQFAERQIRLAADLGKKMVFWFPKGALATSDAEQRSLLESIRNAKGITSPYSLFEDVAVRNMIGEVLHTLKPDRTPEAHRNGDGPSVYLICDRSTPEDSDFAEQLRERIQATEGLQVLLPEPKPPAGVSIEDAHQTRLRQCDGVLLYRKAAPLPWLQQQAPGVLLAEQILQRPAFRAKAFLVDDPRVLPGFPNVISQPPEFDLKALEPFLGPLRQTGGMHAGG